MSALIMTNIEGAQFQLKRTVIANKSPFNAKTQRSVFFDHQWFFSFQYPWMRRVEALPLMAALAAQDGGAGTLLVHDPDNNKPLAGSLAAAGNGTVAGAGQTDSTLNVNFGTSADGSLVARAGEVLWLTYPGPIYRMFTLVADSLTVGTGGAATLTLDRPVIVAPADGAALGFDWVASFRGIPARLTDYQKQTDRVGNVRISIGGEELV